MTFRTHLARSSALLLAAALSVAAYAQNGTRGTPPSAASVAQRGITAINTLATQCAQRLGDAAATAASRIDGLQTDGNQAGAERAARVASERVNRAARECVQHIRRQAEITARALHRLGAAEDLLASVRAAATQAINQVNAARAAAIQTILGSAQP